MKLCSYNFVLNEAPNTNDVTHVVNIVLNKVSNSNDAMHVVNNVHLTTMHWRTTILNAAIDRAIMQKSQLTRDKR